MYSTRPDQDIIFKKRDNFQSLCHELIRMGDIMTCAATSAEGKLLGADYGTLPVPESFRERNAKSVGQILRAFDQEVELGGPLESIAAGHAEFVLLLISIRGTNAA